MTNNVNSTLVYIIQITKVMEHTGW